MTGRSAGRPTPEQLWALKNGDDDGIKRSWAQIGDMLGYNASYLSAVAGHRVNKRIATLLTIDPRQYLPELVDTMSDDDVADWNADPYCLCGCEEATQREHSNKARVPRGAPRLFFGSHFARRNARQGLLLTLHDPEIRRRANNQRRALHQVNAAVLSELLLEWRSSAPGRSFPQLALTSGVSQANIYRYANAGGWIEKSTMARLLVAIGEPLRPELASALEEWSKNKPASALPVAISV